MTLTDILSANGVADDVSAAILTAMKDNKIFTASEENLDIRYGKLKTQHDGVNQQLTEANALIDDLKKTNKGAEGLQQKVTEYENKVAQMQQELELTKIDAAVKVALLSSKAVDVDYLTFKLREKMTKDGESLTLDDNGDIKGWTDKLDGLKTQFPTMFESGSDNNGGYQVFNPNKLPKGDDGNHAPTKDQFKGMNYEQRLNLKNENPELFKKLAY